ncbi:MAG: hypothetical protein SPG03_03475 [Veillonella caviae]|uniref:hypothetical protein n=1 Tax=Veillonella caviae TaxID=248316 RepID=UPI002A90FDCF|nr:hypothetical protein [Veillonella caviae]MDY5481434.1 hypothetical protein [Veillonella caviae]
MLGTIIYKNNFDAELYSNCALWANNNNAELVEREDCYVVQAITKYEPTKVEKIADIKKYYDARFETLDQALLRRRLANVPYDDLQAQFKKLNAEMVAKIKEVK